MDTSSTYIKMCDCPEIQEQAKYEDFNYFIDCQIHRVRHSHPNDYDYMKSMNVIHEELEYIWLPRQDQIQEMLGKDSINIELNKFYVFCLEKSYIGCLLPTTIFKSLEQLWLAFYMYEKHGKTWDGKEWIK